MEKMQRTLIVRATKALKLRDIALYQARFERPIKDVGGEELEALQQHKRGVTYAVGSTGVDDNPEQRLLQVRVSLGTRVVPKTTEGEPVPLFVIEADYLVEYELNEDLPEEAIRAFAEFNVIHNVWPFWREHVFNIVGRGRLPRLEVPLYEGAVL